MRRGEYQSNTANYSILKRAKAAIKKVRRIGALLTLIDHLQFRVQQVAFDLSCSLRCRIIDCIYDRATFLTVAAKVSREWLFRRRFASPTLNGHGGAFKCGWII
uniref:Uncharacterized protein n=1 Tax=Romanomermis culicivorax TaxID=13658 RepID=A0A915J767_ROMCU